MGIALDIGIAFRRSEYYHNEQAQLFCANQDGICPGMETTQPQSPDQKTRVTRPRGRWRYSRAALFGFALSILATLVNGRWPQLKAYLLSGEPMAAWAAIVELAAAPLIFMLIAAVRNLIWVRRL